MSLDELTSYAVSRNVPLRAGLTKAEILSELSQQAQAGERMAEAEDLAAAQGR